MTAATGLIGFVIAVVLSSIIVNALYRAYMKLTGADVMFFSKKKKLFVIVLLALVLYGLVLKLTGVA